MGFNEVFYGFVVAFLAGMSSGPIRMGLVGLLIGEFYNLTTLFFDPEWSPVGVFGILFLYIVYQSLIGRWAGLVRRLAGHPWQMENLVRMRIRPGGTFGKG
jgi:hypothetical protein